MTGFKRCPEAERFSGAIVEAFGDVDEVCTVEFLHFDDGDFAV